MRTQLPRIGEWASFDELRDLQTKRIPDVLARAARSPFYAARFGGDAALDAERFAALPLTTKAELAGSYPFGMLAVPPEEVANYFESSGSGGDPTPAFYTEADWQDLVERFARKTVEIRPSDTLMVRSPYALGLAGHLADRAGRYRGATVIPGDNRSSVVPYPRVVRVLRDLRVTLTWSNPTDCLLWAVTAQRAGLDPALDFPHLRALFTGGEPMSPARRRRISELWGGVPVIDEYGCTEVGSLAGTCPHDRVHLWADRVLPEVHDPGTGSVGGEGVGELVLTPLYVEAMPLVRYNLHDRVELRYDECPCGWHLPLLRVLGRTAQGYRVGRAHVTQLGLEELVFSLPRQLNVLFWRARAEADRLELQIEADPAHAKAAERALVDAVGGALGTPCRVDVLPPGGLVPDEVVVNPRQSVKPRALYGPGENWDQAIVFPRS